MIHDQHPRADCYPGYAGARRVDTSIAAADWIAPKVGRLQQMVLDALRSVGAHGRTTNELAAILNIDRGSIQPRTSELRRLGRIMDSGQRRANANGKRAIVWVIRNGGEA